MLEVVRNHDYGKSRFLRGAAVDETKIGIGPSRVERQMRDELDQFLPRHSVLKRKPQMKGQLVGAVERNERGHRDKAPVSLGESAAFPHPPK